jgi:hypothetical protein
MPGFFANSKTDLRSLNIGCLLAFWTLGHFKSDLLAFFE